MSVASPRGSKSTPSGGSARYYSPINKTTDHKPAISLFLHKKLIAKRQLGRTVADVEAGHGVEALLHLRGRDYSFEMLLPMLKLRGPKGNPEKKVTIL